MDTASLPAVLYSAIWRNFPETVARYHTHTQTDTYMGINTSNKWDIFSIIAERRRRNWKDRIYRWHLAQPFRFGCHGPRVSYFPALFSSTAGGRRWHRKIVTRPLGMGVNEIVFNKNEMQTRADAKYKKTEWKEKWARQQAIYCVISTWVDGSCEWGFNFKRRYSFQRI